MNPWKVAGIVFGLLVSLLAWVGKDQLAQVRGANDMLRDKVEERDAQIVELQTALKLLIQQVDTDARDASQDKTLVKHWRLHSWARDQVNALRHAQGQPPVPWPELN